MAAEMKDEIKAIRVLPFSYLGYTKCISMHQCDLVSYNKIKKEEPTIVFNWVNAKG